VVKLELVPKRISPDELVRDLIDKLGLVEEQLDIPEVALWKAREKSATELRKEITLLAGGEPDLPVTLQGHTHTAVLGLRENEKQPLNKGKLFKRIGKTLFCELAGFTFTAFDALSSSWPAEDKAAFVITERTGSRPVKTFRMEDPAKTA
jgi:hypothetical protein